MEESPVGNRYVEDYDDVSIDEELERANRELEAEEEDIDADELYGGEELIPGATEKQRERDLFLREGIDPDEYEDDLIASDEDLTTEINPKDKRAAERRMLERDRQDGINKSLSKRGHIQGGTYSRYLDQMLDEADVDVEEVERRRQRRKEKESKLGDDRLPSNDLVAEAKNCLRLNDPQSSLWSSQIEEAICTLFKLFLYSYTDHFATLHMGAPENEAPKESKDIKLYVQKLREMQLEEETALYVSIRHLLSFHCESFPEWIKYKPTEVLDTMSEVVTAECLRHKPYIYEGRICTVLLMAWPEKVNFRHLRSLDINTMIHFTGVVTKRTGVLPRLRELYLSCTSCGESLNDKPFLVVPSQPFRPPGRCLVCGRSVFKIDRVKTLFQNFQKITIQESPGSVPPGRAPRSIQVLLTGSLTDRTKPGEEVDVLGVYKITYDIGLNIKAGFPVLATHVLANNVDRKEDVRVGDLTQEDIQEIIQLSKDNNIRERIITSIAPALYGFKQVKTAIAYALFGGLPKGRQTEEQETSADKGGMKGGHQIRGDINVLLLGDPGLGKSQALQFVHRTFHRTVYTTGKGASAVGLTAGVKRDPVSGEWTLEGGALVLADEGICLIDEFDKMTDKDRVSIHEAMEQQSISISKAGIVTELKARCAVIAAANPKFGRYEPSLTFKENVALSDPILSRFDLIAVLRDIPNFDTDYSLADYVVTSHILNHPGIDDKEEYAEAVSVLEEELKNQSTYEPIPQQLLQKYIIYARNKCKPTLKRLDKASHDKLGAFYSQLRQRASRSGGYPMTLRHVESIVRISEANAKMRLSNYVLPQDIDMAIATMLESFISSQKHAVASSLGKEFARYRALARGGFEMLGEIARRQMQDLMNRGRVRGTLDVAEPQLLSVEHFQETALRQKFTTMNIDSWYRSKDFQNHFNIIEKNESKYIVSKNLKKRQDKKQAESGGGSVISSVRRGDH